MIPVKMQEPAETSLGGKVNDAVLTVPAYSATPQRQATKDTETIAGLNMMRIITELTAVARYMAWKREQWGAQCPGLRHGRSTFDVSLLPIEELHLRCRATAGDRALEAKTLTTALATFACKISSAKARENLQATSGLYGGCSPRRATRALLGLPWASWRIGCETVVANRRTCMNWCS